MSVIQKTLFAENLDAIPVYINDTESNSKYFKITELPDAFTGGKNAFLIQGSEFLVADTIVKIEIKDAQGNIIYHEPGEGMVTTTISGEPIVTEYYEGTSKVVSVYIYPDTAYGPCTITILGEAKDVPPQWDGVYNVKWQKSINVNPALANSTKIRFYKRPLATINEIIQPIYQIVSGSKVSTGINQSFANIKLSQMETFAGDVKRVKVFRTSQGDISDYDLIQDIYVEAKELLTTYNLSGSVVGNAGIFTSEVLSKQWTTSGGLSASQNTSRIESGVRLVGTGNLTYTSSLDFNANNTYELNLDAFFSGNLAQDLGVWIASGSESSSIATLSGITPTKNLLDSTYQFKLDKDYISASLYFSQSYSLGEWHIGNISLKLTQDTTFSPDEISFVTTMPTVVGNESYNFKFEFYDVNNNYVPVYVTQSAQFTGGTTLQSLAGTIDSSSLATSSSLYAVSQSISGTAALYFTSSISTSLYTSSLYTNQVSASLTASISSSLSSSFGYASSSIYSLSSSVSSSNANVLSSSLSKVQNLADGRYSGSFISGNIVYAPVIGGQTGYFSQKFQVGSTNPIVLDASSATRKIYVGAGNYNNSDTSVYMDSGGQFSLKDQLLWNGSSLTVNGTINVTGGNAATDANALLYSQRAAASASISASAAQTNAVSIAASDATTKANLAITTSAISASNAALSASAAYTNAKAVADSIAAGTYTGGTLISNKSIISPIIAGADGYFSNTFKVGNAGITLDGTNKAIYIGTGTYNNTNTGFYVDSSGNFSLKDKLTWDGTTLSVTGKVVITSGATYDAIATAQSTADSKITGAQVNANVTAIDGSSITTGTVNTNRLNVSGIISAGSIIVSGNNVSSLTNDSGYQNNGAAKTAGSVGGWAITSNEIDGGSPTGGGDGSYTTTGIRLGASGWISAKNFYIDSSGNASFKGNITATGGSFSGTVTAGTGVTIGPGGITCSGDNQGVDIGGGRGIYSSTGGNIYISGPAGSGVFFVTDSDGLGGMNWGSLSPGRLDIYRGFNNNAAVTISAYGGSGDIIYSYGYGGYNYTGDNYYFKPNSGYLQFYLQSLQLDPSSPGTNDTLKAVRSNGKVFTSSSTRKRKNIYGNWKNDESVLQDIKKVPVERFKYKSWEDGEVETFGLIAEDLHNNGFWQSVTYDADDNGKAIYEEEKVAGIDYEKVTSVLWKAVQELTKKVEDLETKLNNK